MDKKVFSVNGSNYIIEKPSDSILEQSEDVYAQKIGEMIAGVRTSNGKKILFRSQLEEFLKEQGIWTDKDEKELEEIFIKQAELNNKLELGGIKLSEGRKIALEIFDLTKKSISKQYKRKSFDESTAESLAEKAQIEYIISRITYPENGNKPVWETYEELESGKYEDVYKSALPSYYKLMAGQDGDMIFSRPEVKWLKDYGFLDDNLRMVDRKTGEPVDFEGNVIPEEEREDPEVAQQPFIDDETGEPVEVK